MACGKINATSFSQDRSDKESASSGTILDVLSQLRESSTKIMDMDALKEKLKSVPNPFNAYIKAGSVHEEGEHNGPS